MDDTYGWNQCDAMNIAVTHLLQDPQVYLIASLLYFLNGAKPKYKTYDYSKLSTSYYGSVCCCLVCNFPD